MKGHPICPACSEAGMVTVLRRIGLRWRGQLWECTDDGCGCRVVIDWLTMWRAWAMGVRIEWLQRGMKSGR